MIEPTETESKETLDDFIDAMKEDRARKPTNDPDLLHSAPHTTEVSRLDEVGAAREPNLRWRRAAAGAETPELEVVGSGTA